jgi:hypothetical protein
VIIGKRRGDGCELIFKIHRFGLPAWVCSGVGGI